MFKLQIIISIFVSIFLFACGGSNNSSKPIKPTSTPSSPNPKAATTIKSFTLKESNINANIKSGSFSFSWQVQSSDPYEVDIYVSKDSFLTEKTDIRIFGQRCGSTGSYRCDEKADFKCQFKTDNKITCAFSDTGADQTDISSLLSSLPQTAFIIMEACNISYTNCKVKSQKVKFQ